MKKRTLFAILALLPVFVTSPAFASFGNYLVYSSADSGAGSLRQAILDANGTGGTISFVFSGSSVIGIRVLTPLPVITQPVIIDGYSMPGAAMAGRPLVEITDQTGPSEFSTGFDVQAPGCLIRGLIINNFYVGINIGSTGGTTIQGNWIGLTADGASAFANTDGITTEAGSSNNHIGGTGGGQRNVISGNSSTGITIGKSCSIGCTHSLSDVIEGNYIGTDTTGAVAVPNGIGVWVTGWGQTTIIGGTGQTGSNSRNVISGNTNEGVSLDGSAYVQYNWIGLSASGSPLGNQYTGVSSYAGGTTISYNTIAYNAAHGILVGGGTGTAIYFNSIYWNSRLGISLGNIGPTPNDPGDTDTGPNNLQNYPVITSAITDSNLNQRTIAGTLNSLPNANYYVTFYSNQACDPSGYGEGETYLSAASVNTDANGNASFNLVVPGASVPGTFITAIARDSSLNSSEFSQCRQVFSAGPPAISSISPASGPWGTTVTISGTHLGTVASVGFNSGSLAASFQIVSDTQITTTVPVGTLTGPIGVVNPSGSALSGTFTVDNPAPSLTTISPNSGVSTGGTNVTIRGSSLWLGATVTIGNVGASNVVVVNSTTITATTGAHLHAGTVDVVVANSDGKTAKLINGFTYFCSPDIPVNITAPRSVPPNSSNNTASVPDAGPGATYSWKVTGGTLTSGSGTHAITFSAGTANIVLFIEVARADCAASSTLKVPVVLVHDDFNNDGNADILLQNELNGDVAIWLMNGTSLVNGILVGNSGSYRAVTTGDFDGDGRNDIVLQDPTTGAIAMWKMNGTTISAGLQVTNPGVDWRVVGSGDVNGHRRADLVLQNAMTGDVAVWLMNGASITSGGLVGTPGTSFRVAGIGDFNHDGNSDILLQSSSGDIAVWLLNGLTIIGGAAIGNPGAGWIAKAVGDVDGDGSSDILFQNSNTGDIAVWRMQGLQIVGGTNMGGPGAGYPVMGSADYDGDGDWDLLLRDAGNAGSLYGWLLTGTTIKSGGLVGSPSTDYVPVTR